MDQAPADTELRNIIDKLAQFVARNGPEFEQMTKNKQKDNPKFSFLFGGEYFNYYQYKVTTEQAILKQKGINPMQNADPRLSVSQQQHTAVNNVGMTQNNGLGSVQHSMNNNSTAMTGSATTNSAHLQGLSNAGPGHLPGSQNSIGRSPSWLQNELNNLQAQQTTLQDQVRQSEQNLAAQHSALMAQQQGRVEDAVRQAQENTLQTNAQTTNTDLAGFDAVLQPIIDSCTKDSISAGKAWILQNSTTLESNQVIAEHLLKRAIQETAFTQKLHIIYLVNDVLHHCARKKSVDLRKAMESVVVPMFCNTSLAATEEQLNKLNKLLSLWESKSNYFEEGIIEKLKNPTQSWTDYQASVMSQHANAISSIAATTKQTFDNYQAQHQAFVNHAMRQIQSIEQQKVAIDQELKAPPPAPMNQTVAPLVGAAPHSAPPPHSQPPPVSQQGSHAGPPAYSAPPPNSQHAAHPTSMRDGPPPDERGAPYAALPPTHGSHYPGHGGIRPDERGPPYDRGPPFDERGPPYDRGMPFDERGPPRGPPFDERGPPYDRGPPFDERGPPRGPPFDERGPPRGPPFDERGPPYDRGPPFEERGPPYDRGPPFDERGPPYDRGPPFDERGPPRGPAFDERGPPRGPPFEERGPPRGPPFDERGPPRSLFDDRGPPRGPPFDERGPPPYDRGPYGLQGPPPHGSPPHGGIHPQYGGHGGPPASSRDMGPHGGPPISGQQSHGDHGFAQPPPGWNMPPGGGGPPPPAGGGGPGADPFLPLPDFSKPPPCFSNPPPLMAQEICMEDLMPSMPYFELPAGLMVPLIKLEESEYRPLDPDAIRLPPPAPPNERLVAAVEAFYSMPNHDSPRDSDGWEKLGLYEYYRAKNAARKRKEDDIRMGLRPKSRSPSPITRVRSKSPSPPKKRYRSKSRSKSRSRSRSPETRRSKSPVHTPNHRRNSRSNHNSSSRSNRRRRNSGKTEHASSLSGSHRSPDRRVDRSERSPSPPSFLGSSYGKSHDMELDESNKGHQLLRKMGWGGAGLGVKEQGIEAPISGGEIRDRLDQYKGVGINLNDPYENFRKSKGQAFITRMKARAEERAEDRTERVVDRDK